MISTRLASRLKHLVPCSRVKGTKRLPRKFYGTNHGSHGHEEKFNEPGGRLFGESGKKSSIEERIYYVGFIGGLALLVFLYQYKPGPTPDEWGRQEALRRMSERGINLDDYRYNPPQVY